MVTVIILTKNEEKNIGHCIRSLNWCSDIVVLDSGSTDETCRVANQLGVRVEQHEFRSFAAQRNWALENLSLKNRWVLFLDADEESTQAFANSLLSAVAAASDRVVGFFCCWKMMLGGRWLKHSDSFPKWQLRVVRVGYASFKDVGHGQKEGAFDGDLYYIKEPYVHYCFRKGWFDWVAKHNIYSTKEAEYRSGQAINIRGMFSVDASRRNVAFRSICTRTPLWPLVRFLHAYVWSCGFLEGGAGFRYCVMLAWYEYLIVIKVGEKKMLELVRG